MTRLLPFLFFSFFCITLDGQEAVAREFGHLGVGDGLSQSLVNCLLRDRTGFLWIGTQDGLNRYDGYSFRHFFNRPGDTASLANNYIWCLLEDSRGRIWAGTFGGGLCRFDPFAETFRTYRPVGLTQNSLSENSIRTLFEYPEGTIWAGTDAGLWKMDAETGLFQKAAGLNHVRSVKLLGPGVLMIGAGEGLFLYEAESGMLSPVLANGASVPSVSSILAGIRGNVWVGTLEGVYRFGAGDALRFVEAYTKAGGQLPSDVVNDLVYTWAYPDMEVEGSIWAGTFEGLVRVDRDLAFETILDKDAAGPQSSNIINCLLEVQPGLLWVGTREGIAALPLAPRPFRSIGLEEGLCGSSILGIREDFRENLWVATRSGLTRIKGEETECLTPRNTPSMPFEYIINLFPVNPDSSIAIFRQNGFAWLHRDLRGKWRFSRIRDLDGLIGDAGITTLAPDGEPGVFWVGTPGLGLVRWHSATGEYEHFSSQLPHAYVFCLLADSEDRFWIGTANGGLCRMDRAAGTFTCFTSSPDDPDGLSANMVLSLFEDSCKRLWVCTANGLNLWEGEGRFRKFFQDDGLPNNVVYGMLEDESGDLWVSTNRGLCRLSFEESGLRTTQFHASDGIGGEEFNQYAFYRTRDGRLCFGSTEGLTIFRPSSIRPYPVAPKVALTEFRLFNRPALVGEIGDEVGDYTLPRALPFMQEIVLRHDQNFIEFGISALGFLQPENNQYAYKMEGVDEDWVYCGSRRFASYPGLSSGRYRFLAKAANHDGVWSEEPVAISLVIKPPWWRTLWAYLTYFLAAGALVWALFRWRMEMVRKMERARVMEREAIRKRVALDFHDEAGNKITKMALLAEVARRNIGFPERLASLLAQMEENVQELRLGMRDFIWTLDPDKDNLYDTLVRIKDFAHGMFAWSDIRFSAPAPDESFRQVSLGSNQRRHFIMLFKEAVNNCLKYSRAQNARFSADREAGRLVLVFQDDGKGFEPVGVKEGNGLKNMASRAEKAGGELSISSAPGKGTTICLVFPLPTNHPKG